MLTVNRVSGQNSDVLTLFLYPYVPDIERFKSAITEEWGRHHPDIRLEYSDWDCYSGILPENVDVFVYDTVYFDQYLKQGLLLPLSKADIKDIDDFFPFAIEASTTGETIYTENNSPYIFGEWFTDGVGRAFIGFSEAMSVMGDSTDEIDFHLYSMTEEPNIPLFYMDAASVNANISQEKRALAIELLNLITGTDILVRASSPNEPDQSHQYLLSARKSFYDIMEKKDPIYTELQTFVSSPDNHIFSARNEDLAALYDTSLITSLLTEN